MKTAKYYRFNEKIGGMRGGEIGKKEPGKFSTQFRKWGHSIAAPFKGPWRGESGSNLKNANGSAKSTQNIIDVKRGFFTTKSTRLRQAEEAAMRLSLKDQKRAEKITKQPVPNAKPLSESKKKKREGQTLNLAGKLGLNTTQQNFIKPETKQAAYKELQIKIRQSLNDKKKKYATETFQTLKKTINLKSALDTSKTEYNAAKHTTSEKTRNYTKEKEIKNLLKLLKKTPKNIPTQDALKNLDSNRFTNNKFNSIEINKEINQAKTNLKKKKQKRDEAFNKEKKQTQTFTKYSKALEAHTAKYGTTNALKQYSNNQTIASKTGRVLAKTAKYTGIATGVAALGALTAVAPPVGIILGAKALGAVAGAKLNKKFTKKSSLLKTLYSNKATANNKEDARNLIIKKTNSPEVQYKLDKALDKGQGLIEKLGEQKDTLLSGTYNAFKKFFKESKTNYTPEDYKTLKEYYAANKIKQIREGTIFSKNSELGKTTPSFLPFSKKPDTKNPKSFKQTTEQRLQTFKTQQIKSLPKNETTGTLSELKNDNYQKFLPLLRIKPESVNTNTTLKTLFTNKQQFTEKQSQLKEIIGERYKQLKYPQSTTTNQNSTAELEKIEKLAKLYNIILPSSPL